MKNEDELINRHFQLVLNANKTINLTRIVNKKEGYLLHIEDSLSGLEEVNNAPEGLYGDMGTGGGYPGIPLAIKTKRKTVLIDSVKKKTAALDCIIEQLGMSEQIKTYTGRIEELSLVYKNQFSVLTARALSQLSSLLELSSPLLKTSGVLVCYKANLADDELERALQLESKLGMRLQSIRNFALSDNMTHRCIVSFEKYKEPEVRLPRKTGMAQKRPLKP